MKERPILFNGPMVQALLDGRKTQTRRQLKMPRGYEIQEREDGSLWPWMYDSGGDADHWLPCPYGQHGDRLWVRETWGVVSHYFDDKGNVTDWTPDRPAKPIYEMPFGGGYYSGHVIYAADGNMEWAGDDDGDGEPRSAWHPSIHMPRAASRILLEVLNVRVERLQEIGKEDAIAEGMADIPTDDHVDFGIPGVATAQHPIRAYQLLWDSINGPGSWDANPFVWVVQFKIVKGDTK